MNPTLLLTTACLLAPAAWMVVAMASTWLGGSDTRWLWRRFALFTVAALGFALWRLAFTVIDPAATVAAGAWAHLHTGPLGAWLAVLVQLLGTVIGGFSSRYLQGEARQGLYVRAFAGVLAGVHLLLLADHWVVLIGAWAAVGAALRPLLSFYPERPFALLAAHKKRLADRAADLLLVVAAALAWTTVGSGSLSALWAHLAHLQHLAPGGISPALQGSAVCLVLAVVLRTALLPVHGWLVQVMEAPTPVSALLHAGVVNLGGDVLIRFAPLLDEVALARWLLVAFGLGTAVLAGMVMLTRISIKVRLAWSTVAQMGFMLLECGLGLYTLAALHLIGHSLYKAHTFLSASAVVRNSRLDAMRGDTRPSFASLLLAPVLTLTLIGAVMGAAGHAVWPWAWSVVLAMGWAPLLWLPATRSASVGMRMWRLAAGLATVVGLSALALLLHGLPLGVSDRPDTAAAAVAAGGMVVLYLVLVTLHWRARLLEGWRRWSYAGFYIDEYYTRLALRIWPTRWARDVPAARMNPTS